MARASRIQHVRDQHGIVAGRELDAAEGEQLQAELEVMTDLEDAGMLEQWLQGRKRGAFVDLIGHEPDPQTGPLRRRHAGVQAARSSSH